MHNLIESWNHNLIETSIPTLIFFIDNELSLTKYADKSILDRNPAEVKHSPVHCYNFFYKKSIKLRTNNSVSQLRIKTNVVVGFIGKRASASLKQNHFIMFYPEIWSTLSSSFIQISNPKYLFKVTQTTSLSCILC